MDEGSLLTEILKAAGYEVVLGNGTLEDGNLAECDVLIPGRCRVDEKVIEKAPQLKVVAKPAVGVDNIDIPACSRHGENQNRDAKQNRNHP